MVDSTLDLGEGLYIRPATLDPNAEVYNVVTAARNYAGTVYRDVCSKRWRTCLDNAISSEEYATARDAARALMPQAIAKWKDLHRQH